MEIFKNLKNGRVIGPVTGFVWANDLILVESPNSPLEEKRPVENLSIDGWGSMLLPTASHDTDYCVRVWVPRNPLFTVNEGFEQVLVQKSKQGLYYSRVI